jgi:hypothetical protein
MYRLFRTQFDGVSPEEFDADLEQKNWLLLLEGDESLAGFSTIDVRRRKVGGRQCTIVFSGDTVVDTKSWSDSALSYNWMGAISHLQQCHPHDRFLWFLLVSGYRTYRFLPVYSKEFYPHHAKPTPPETRQLMDQLAMERYGERYDPVKGIVRLRVPALLRQPLRGIPRHRMADPHIAHFARLNPGHDSGDELVCLAELGEQNLTRLGLRMWRRGAKLFCEPTPT